MIKLFIFMSSLIFHNQNYHCVLHQVLHIFINQVLPIFLYQEGRGHILIRIQNQGGSNYGKSILSLLGGEKLICKCSDGGGGGEFPAKKYFWRESTTTKPVIRRKIWLAGQNAIENVENLVRRILSSMQHVSRETSPKSVPDVRSRSVAVNKTQLLWT